MKQTGMLSPTCYEARYRGNCGFVREKVFSREDTGTRQGLGVAARHTECEEKGCWRVGPDASAEERGKLRGEVEGGSGRGERTKGKRGGREGRSEAASDQEVRNEERVARDRNNTSACRVCMVFLRTGSSSSLIACSATWICAALSSSCSRIEHRCISTVMRGDKFCFWRTFANGLLF